MPPSPAFPSTQWSMILSIKPSGEDEVCPDSINKFFKAYHGAVQSYIESMGIGLHDAEDITQDIFATIHRLDQYSRLQPDKGRMRAFLKTVAKNRVMQFYRNNSRQKRGGNQTDLALDEELISHRSIGPDQEFDKKWAMSLLEVTAKQVGQDYHDKGRKDWFDALYPVLTLDDGKASYAEIATKLNSSEGAVRVASYRLRQKYRDALRTQVAKTVATEDEVDGELQLLFKTLSGE